ncbi:hypothetical protein SAMN04244573_04318 [Azotobacter beijerinckii]|uniref:Uncharacterized protein n=1 Tax=Azotobacter beijerinckii TaxID=170623 RepID=A0A1H9S3S2_9GAMM|nr:hypothetical protein [Azotobacter beijerinckii]SER78779.1 hypothetical protein SAMN04244573_04318 [Azotobacter beijerinckii]
MNIYPLYVFDCARHTDILPPRIEGVAMAEQVIVRLRDDELGPHPRFERLGMHLARHFPSLPETLPATAMEEEIEAYLDMEPFWIGDSPDHQLRRWTSALWVPEIIRIDQMPELLKLLLLLARQLCLDVYEEIYLPATSLTIPTGEGDRYRLFFDPVAGPKQFTGDAFRTFLIERLNVALAGLGFGYQAFFFSRRIEGGKQLILGPLCGRAPALSCEVRQIGCSDRLAATKHEIYGPSWSLPTYPRIFYVYLRGTQELARHGWKAQPFAASSYTTNEEEVDWMVSDLLGLPILERTRAVEGVDWLFSSEAVEEVFLDNLHGSRSIIDDYKRVTIYAHRAGSLRFGAIVADVEQRIAKQHSMVTERYRALVELCRTSVQPVGSGVA